MTKAITLPIDMSAQTVKYNMQLPVALLNRLECSGLRFAEVRHLGTVQEKILAWQQ